MLARFLSDRRKRELANYLHDLRHKIIAYPLDRIDAARVRTEDFPTRSAIPRTIVQTYRSAEVARPIHSAVVRWQEMNPEFDYRFFDDEAARAFIEARFPADMLESYDSLVPGAYRADLWRYCYLVEEGGVYVDIRMEPLVALRTILGSLDDDPPRFAAARDLLRKRYDRRAYIYNAFIAATPRHPFMVASLDRALTMIRNRDYGRDSLDITGPGCMGAALNEALGRPAGEPIEPGDHDAPSVGRYRILCHDHDVTHRNVLTVDGRPTILTKCIHGPMRNADRHYPQRPYSKLYNARRVFR